MKKKGKEPTSIGLLCGGLGFLFGWFLGFFTVSTNNLGSSKIKMIILVLTSTDSVLLSLFSFWIKRESWLPHQQEL